MESGRHLLADFLSRHGLTLVDAGKRLGISYVAVRHWVHRSARPSAEQRDKIAQLTGGLIPREAWRTPEEQAAIDAVKPLTVASDDAIRAVPSQPESYESER